ncbi:MAG: SH3 domain-containing protein [Inquilinus sp.]|nr:SH3 domain-containing protein [Inquilinus sp.]
MFGLLLRLLAIALFVAAIVEPGRADEIKRSTYDRYDDKAIVNAGPLNLRESPSTDSRVLMQLAPGDAVVILEEYLPVTVGDRQGRWVFVATPHCIGTACEYVTAGWLADVFLDRAAEAGSDADSETSG